MTFGELLIRCERSGISRNRFANLMGGVLNREECRLVRSGYIKIGYDLSEKIEELVFNNKPCDQIDFDTVPSLTIAKYRELQQAKVNERMRKARSVKNPDQSQITPKQGVVR